MRLARRVPAVALPIALAGALACSDDGDPTFRRAAGFYNLTQIDGRTPPVALQTAEGTIFVTRGTMQLHDDGRFAMGIEQNFAGGVRPAAWTLVQGRYALRGGDSAMTVTLEPPDSRVLAATLAGKQATVPMFGARLLFERP
jgi:hypothetical protein